MKTKSIIRFLTIACLGIGMIQGGLFAQKVSISGLVSIPNGDFAEDDKDDEESGFAKTGYGAELGIDIPISEQNLFLLINVMGICNPRDISHLEDPVNFPGSNYRADVNNPSSLSIPIMGGITYYHELSETSQFYFLGEFGVCLNSMSEVELEKNRISGNPARKIVEKWDYESSSAFGVGFGAGFQINKLRLGFKFLSLGEHEKEVEYTKKEYIDMEPLEPIENEIEVENKISMMTFSIGVTF